MSRSRVPWGPLTETWRSVTLICTPFGTGMGARPIRDTAGLPDVAEDLAADLALTRLAVGEETLAGGQDGHAEPAEHARQAVGAGVDAEARDRARAVGGVLHLDLEDPARATRVVVHGEPLDVPLPGEQGGQRLLEL